MSLEQLGLFGRFGRQVAPGADEGEAPAPHQLWPQAEATDAVLALLDASVHAGAWFLGPWAAPTQHDAAGMVATGADRSPNDWLVRLDSWAWAPQTPEQGASWRWTRMGTPASTAQCASAGERPAPDVIVLDSARLAHSSDPRPLLRAVKKAALTGIPCWILDQDKVAGARAFADLADWLDRHGFAVQRLQGQGGFDVLVCHLDAQRYRTFLARHGMDPALLNVTKLLITSEDADVHPTGGIGTYIKNVRALNPTTGTLLCQTHAVQSAMPARTLCPQPFVGAMGEAAYLDGLGLVENMQAILCLLPSIDAIEFQDYRSIGFRLVQAKRTGRLPVWLHVSVFLHGSVDYVKYGVGDESAVNYGIHELKYTVKDAYIFEHVDECVAPSRYLAQRLLSEEFGYTLNNLRYVRLPFDQKLIPACPPAAFKPITRLIYVGKYNRLKGWDDFVQAVEALAGQGALAGIKEIVSLAPTAPSRAHRSRLAKVADYQALHLSHAQLLAFLTTHRDTSLVVIPSRGENYPFVVLEQLLVGTRFVAYDAGGAPEVVDDADFVQRFFCAPTPVALAARIAELAARPPEADAPTLADFNQRAVRRQAEINRIWSRPHVSQSSVTQAGADPVHAVMAPPACGALDDAIALAVPVYNTPLAYVRALLHSVLQSTVKPATVLLVDDGSQPGYHDALVAEVRDTLGAAMRWSVHRQQNRGLAGARNAALQLLKQPFVFFLDSDDCLYPHTLLDAGVALLRDDRLVAATGFAVYHRPDAGADDTASLHKADFWMPLGTEKARALSVFENQFLTANAMVRSETYRRLGGWDESDRSMWEDWALYTRLAWSGHAFSLIPAAGYRYRTSADSMSKTYSRYGGRRRLVRNLPFASRMDANILFSLVNGAGSERSLLAGPALSEREAELIQFIRSLTNRPRMKAWILRLYGLYSSLRRKV